MATQPSALSYYNPQVMYDENGNPISPQANPALSPQPPSFGPPPGSFGAVPNPSSPAPGPYGGVYGNPVATPQFDASNINDINVQGGQNRNYINAAGQQINQEAQGALAYYGPRQQQYGQQADAALNAIAQTPGYTPGESSQINTDYSKYNTSPTALNSQFLTPDEQQAQFLSPTEQQWIAGDPSVGAKVTDQGIANEGGQLNAYGQNLSGQVGNYANYTGQGVSDLKSGVAGANQSLQSGLQGAQSKFSSLDAAVNNPDLAFDPNSTEKQLTDADVQAMKTAAGSRIGNQYKAAEDMLVRNAAAAGNSSPLAIAAANARLQSQEAADQGNSEANADIAARQAQFARAQGIEAQREAAANAQTGFKAGAATTEQAQAQNAAALAGTTGVNSAGLVGTQGLQAAKDVAQAGINAVNTYGQKAIDQQNTMTGQQYSADTTAEQQAAARAAAIAQNRQATQTGIDTNRQATQAAVNNTGYSQGTGSAQLTAGGAAKTGDARIAGQDTYLQGVQNQQGMSQQGGQKAIDQQLGAYGTQTGGINQSTSTLANFDVGAPTAVGQATNLIGALVKHDSGATITSPEVGVIAERHPEVVQKIGSYRNARLVTKPTVALLGNDGPERIIPLNANPNNKVNPPRYRAA